MFQLLVWPLPNSVWQAPLPPKSRGLWPVSPGLCKAYAAKGLSGSGFLAPAIALASAIPLLQP